MISKNGNILYICYLSAIWCYVDMTFIAKEIWEANHGETFDCVKGIGFNLFVVTVIRGGKIT